MLRIQLTTHDIPAYWDHIKFAVEQVEAFHPEERSHYLNELLLSLMSNEAQCWICVNDDGEIARLMITRFLEDKQLREKYLYLQVAYAWRKDPVELWQHDTEIAEEFGRQNGCSYIGCKSSNPKIWYLAEISGYTEVAKIHAKKL